MRSKGTEFTVPAAALLEAVKRRVFEVGGSTKGTYNRQDPTAFEKGSCYGYFQKDQYLLKNYRYTPTEEDLKEYPADQFEYAPPPDAQYKITINDVTWGTEVSVSFVDSSIEDEELARYRSSLDNNPDTSSSALVLQFYLDHQDGKIMWEKDLDKVRDFMLFVLCGDMELSNKRRKLDVDVDGMGYMARPPCG